MALEITIPTPETLIAITYFLLGITFGSNIGKRLDQSIKYSDWFKSQDPVVQWVLEKVLDITHHWWVGLLMVIHMAPLYTGDQYQMIYWFGWGLFADDAKDVQHLLDRYKNTNGDESP